MAVLIGIVLAVLIQQLTGYFTGHRPPSGASDVGRARRSPARQPSILAGVALGLESGRLHRHPHRRWRCSVRSCSVADPSLVALFAVALAGCGLLTTAGVIVSMDTFGPVSDNAQGIAEMSGDIDEDGAQVLTDLDAVGNTTKADHQGHRDRDRCAGRHRAVRLVHRRVWATPVATTGSASASDRTSHSSRNLVAAEQPGRRRSSARSVVFLFSVAWPSARSAARPVAVVFEVREQFRSHARHHGLHRAA
mgnify:CR=1 FL=1